MFIGPMPGTNSTIAAAAIRNTRNGPTQPARRPFQYSAVSRPGSRNSAFAVRHTLPSTCSSSCDSSCARWPIVAGCDALSGCPHW